MTLRSLLPLDTAAKLSLALGIAVLIIVALFTLGAVGAVLTGNVAQVENSRLINTSYAILSVGGEAIAIIGLMAGASTLLRKRQLSFALVIGLVLNLVGLILFLPVTFALLLNGFFSLLDYLT